MTAPAMLARFDEEASQAIREALAVLDVLEPLRAARERLWSEYRENWPDDCEGDQAHTANPSPILNTLEVVLDEIGRVVARDENAAPVEWQKVADLIRDQYPVDQNLVDALRYRYLNGRPVVLLCRSDSCGGRGSGCGNCART